MNKINCFLACFDVIGFKALRKTKSTEGLYKLYQNTILPAMLHSAAGQGESTSQGYTPVFSENSLNFKIFSDTIILFSKDSSFNSFLQIINSCHQLLMLGFAGTKAPFRGAIGYGDFIYDNSGVFVGESLENAYLWESKQAWAGCIFTNECVDFIMKRRYFDLLTVIYNLAKIQKPEKGKDIDLNKKRITQYEVPFYDNPKDGLANYYREKRYVLDWTIRMYPNASDKSFLPHNENVHAKNIYINTKQFEEWARLNNR